MKVKPENGKKKGKPSDSPKPEKPNSVKSKESIEDEEDDLPQSDEGTPVSRTAVHNKSSKTTGSEEENGVDGEEVDDHEFEDEWEKGNSEDYDPDFEEFDLPKSKTKSGKKKKSGEEDDFDFEDEFKDMDLFTESSFEDDDEDDF